MIAYGHDEYPCHPEVAVSFRVSDGSPAACPRCGGEAVLVKDGEGTAEELRTLEIIPRT